MGTSSHKKTTPSLTLRRLYTRREGRDKTEAVTYLDQMSTPLIEEGLRNSEENSEVRILARARTATVIQRLDGDNNQNVIRFLSEAGLSGRGEAPISLLAGTDLRGADLQDVSLLDDADLSNANLENADLSLADLSRANLSEANLANAYLVDANLRGAVLDANLSGATMPDGSKHP